MLVIQQMERLVSRKASQNDMGAHIYETAKAIVSYVSKFFLFFP